MRSADDLDGIVSHYSAGLQCSLIRPLQRAFLATAAQANGQENDQEQAHGGLTFW
ncbi:MAG: hypothetical protein V4751_06045 [Pseudomonadota bacterium]